MENMTGRSKKQAKYAGMIWRIELTRSDGLVCKWQFENISKQHAKGLHRDNHPDLIVMKVICTQKGLAYINHLFGGNPSDGKLAEIR